MLCAFAGEQVPSLPRGRRKELGPALDGETQAPGKCVGWQVSRGPPVEAICHRAVSQRELHGLFCLPRLAAGTGFRGAKAGGTARNAEGVGSSCI